MAIVYEKGEVSGYEYFATKQTPHMELGSTEHVLLCALYIHV